MNDVLFSQIPSLRRKSSFMVHLNATKDTCQSVTSSQTVALLGEREILHVSITVHHISAQNSFLWQIVKKFNTCTSCYSRVVHTINNRVNMHHFKHYILQA